nr:ferritin-like domain-containing protein [Campylobacterota bacterium]
PDGGKVSVYKYGDFPVHCGLFDAANHTSKDVLDRMAIIPRYYEASGLDVNPNIVKKLENKRKISIVKKLIESLDIIYKEEIVHVQKGDKWFKEICKSRNLDKSIYFNILEKYKLSTKHRPNINVNARKEAGFSCSEIKKLADVECE